METIENENSIQNSKKIMAPSSLKNNKFKGLTAEQIIKKYEDVLFSREKQFYELSNEITKLTQKIQNLMKKKEKSKYNNDNLKEVLSRYESILKQELSNKEYLFMKINNLENKYDDLQNKINYVINKQNALADSFLKGKGKINQNNEESKKLIDKNPFGGNEENELNFTNKLNKDNNYIKKNSKENIGINNENENEKIFEEKINKENLIKDIQEIKTNSNIEKQTKKDNTFISAREKLNKIKEKKEKVQKLNLSEILSQTDSHNNNI